MPRQPVDPVVMPFQKLAERGAIPGLGGGEQLGIRIVLGCGMFDRAGLLLRKISCSGDRHRPFEHVAEPEPLALLWRLPGLDGLRVGAALAAHRTHATHQ